MIEGLQVFHIRKGLQKPEQELPSKSSAHIGSKALYSGSDGFEAEESPQKFDPEGFEKALTAAQYVFEGKSTKQALEKALQPLSCTYRKNFILNYETCLRQIWIVATGHDQKAEESLQILESDYDIEVFKGKLAYEFILKIICGLDSPVVGETEVFGQFKEQVIKNADSGHKLFPWANQIVGDAKEIRQQYLINLGSQSYGSFCRKLTQEKSRLDVIGLGQFAQSLLPWLEKKQNQGCVFTRKPQCFYKKDEQGHLTEEAKIQTKFKIKALADLPKESQKLSKKTSSSALIICAPIQSKDFDFSKYDLILDLRETSSQDLINHPNLVTLEDVFTDIQKGAGRALEQKSMALEEIKKRSEKNHQQVHLRPFGWDDICA